MNALTPILASIPCLIAAASAQIPSHATQLNPNSGVRRFHVMHLDDVVVTLGLATWPRCSRSNDGGRTWQIIDQIVVGPPVYAADGDGDLIAFVGTNSDAPGSGPQVVISRDRGLTWGPIQQVGTYTQSGTHGDFAIEVNGSTIGVFWSEPGAGTVSMQRSTDAGVTWLPSPILLGSAAQPLVNALMFLDVVVDRAVMHAFWNTRISTGDFGHLQVSTDSGATWLRTPLSTPSPPPRGGATPFARGGPRLLVLAKRLGLSASLLQRSTDSGATWSVVNGLLMPIVYDVAVSGQTVVVVGAEYGFPDTWYIQTSLDGGLTWQAPHFEATAGSGFGATAHIEGPDIFVNFFHQEQPTWSIVAYSGDLGLTWRSMQEQVNQYAPGPLRNFNLHHVSLGFGSAEVWGAVGLGYTPRGVGTTGTGGLVPQLTLSGAPILGTTTSLELNDAVGGTVGVVGLSVAPAAAQPFAGGTLWVQPPLAPFTLATSGAAGAAGVGTASQPFVVPNSVALAGTIVTSQAIVIDGQATDWLSLSNAIECYVN